MHFLQRACPESSTLSCVPRNVPQVPSLPEEQRQILILGMGNTLYGDDGLGVRVAEELTHQKLPPGVAVEIAAVSGIDLVLRMDGWERVIIIDAVQMGEKPGAWRRFRAEDVRYFAGGQGLSLHETGVAQALELAEALGKLPKEVLIYGVEPERLQISEELSPSVQAVIPEITQHILGELWKRER
jgi:hydrogenase maturation protease